MLKVKNLSLHYGDVQALDNVTLHVPRGKLITIVGSNGAGKTSLIQTICGIHPSSSGKITFNGQDITHLKSHEICALRLGHVAEGRQIFPSMTVLENLEVGAFINHKFFGRERDIALQKIKVNLEYVFSLFPKLAERQFQLAGKLSGGEQQMLAIGRCLMAIPRLILFDEPSLGLSPIMAKEMFKIISDLHQQGTTILLVEQNVVASLELADYAYVLENGSVVLSGSGKELLKDDRVRQAYLGI